MQFLALSFRNTQQELFYTLYGPANRHKEAIKDLTYL